MKIDNMFSRNDLVTELKRRDSKYIFASVLNAEISIHEQDGWIIDKKKGKLKTRVRKSKTIPILTEDRIWTILYKMNFSFLCGENGATLFSFQDSKVHNQIDSLAYDDESAIVVECKTGENNKKKEDLKKDIESLVAHRNSINDILRKETGKKIRTAGILVLLGIDPSDADIERARESHITILDATGLEYYEKLIEHIGHSAKYQLLSEVFSDTEIDGLKIKIPAVEAKFGKSATYTFAITPDHLLKIAFIAHRNRGRLGSADDQAYQRMVKKTRLTAIRKFIQNGGIFPTNIVINFSPGRKSSKSGLLFQPTTQAQDAVENVRLGWLILPSRYQSAWIIDGQHRLLAYSGMEQAKKSVLTVTAYDCLDVSEQLELFTKINSEQKKVSGNLLTMLHADLKWSSPDEEEQVLSIVSKIALTLNERTSSPFFKRILLADEIATDTRCINIQSFTSALRKTGLFLDKKVNNKWIKFGALWSGTPEATLKRALSILDEWFSGISTTSGDVWMRGKEEGGYLSMNNGIVVSIEILRSVFEHLEKNNIDCISLKTEDLINHIKPFSFIIGEYFNSLTIPEIMRFRKLVGTTGQTEVRKIVQWEIHKKNSNYNPPGLQEFISSRAEDKVDEIKSELPIIENKVRSIIVSAFENIYGNDLEIWWPEIPQSVRMQVAKLREQDKRAQGSEMNYLNMKLIKVIVTENWQDVFKNKFHFVKSGDKNSRTEWMNRIFLIQEKISGKSKESITTEDYNLVMDIKYWLEEQSHHENF